MFFNKDLAHAKLAEYDQNLAEVMEKASDADLAKIMNESNDEGYGPSMLRDFLDRTVFKQVLSAIPIGCPLPAHQTRVTCIETSSGKWLMKLLVSPIKKSPLQNFSFREEAILEDTDVADLIRVVGSWYRALLFNLMVNENLNELNRRIADASGPDAADLGFSLTFIPEIEATGKKSIEFVSDSELIVVADNEKALKQLLICVDEVEIPEDSDLNAGERQLILNRNASAADARAALILDLAQFDRPVDLLAAKPAFLKNLTNIGMSKAPALVRSSFHRNIDGVKASMKKDTYALVETEDVMAGVFRDGETGEVSVTLSPFNKGTLEPENFDVLGYVASKVA